MRGIGVVKAESEIQIDRYSARGSDTAAVSFLDDTNPHAGWKTTFKVPGSWLRFDEVDFGKGKQKGVEVRAKTAGKSELEIRLDSPHGPVVGQVKVEKPGDWMVVKARVKKVQAGMHDLFVTQTGGDAVEVDWVTFR